MLEQELQNILFDKLDTISLWKMDSLIKLKYYGNLYPGGKGDRVHLISFIAKEKSKQTNKQNIRSRNQILVGFLLTATEAP